MSPRRLSYIIDHIMACMRPLSPHIQIYRWQITSVLSILHRLSGMGFFVLTLWVLLWMLMLSTRVGMYENFMDVVRIPFVRFMIWSLVFCANYHWFNGLRHLIWDMGFGFEIKQVNISGWCVVGCSIVFTLFLMWRW